MTATVTAYFDLDPTGGPFFTLDDTTKGVLDNVTYLLGGPVGSDITPFVQGVTIRRGRDRQLDEITAGVATVQVLNVHREFDPDVTTGEVESSDGEAIITSDGEFILSSDGESGAFGGQIAPGKRLTIAALGITRFDGLIDDWSFAYEVGGMSTAQIEVVDALGTLGAREFDAWTATDGQTSGPRLEDVLDRPEVGFPTGQRNLDTGTSTLQGDNVSWGSNVLNYMQLVTKSDLGQLFASRVNTVTFYGRHHTFTGIGAPIFADDGSGIGFHGVTRARGTELLFNRIGVDREGGVQQTVTDASSVDQYGTESLTLSGLLLRDDDQSLAMAAYLVGLYSDPQTRISSITVKVHGLPMADQLTVLALDIGDVVRVVYTPNREGEPLDTFCLIEGVSETIGLGLYTHEITFSLSRLADGFAGTPFVLDSTEFGVLDQNVLGL